MNRKTVRSLELVGFNDGINTNDNGMELGRVYRSRYPKKQCAIADNVILKNPEFSRRPAMTGLSNGYAQSMKGLYIGEYIDGSERLIMVANGNVYDVSTSSPYAATLKLAITGSGEAFFDTGLNAVWGCNGTKNFKVESDGSTYQIGITAPSGASASAQAGGTLPDGDYGVYISYVRNVGGSNVLYSQSQNLGTVSLGSGNNTIRISSFADSTDLQVNNKVFFCTDAGGSVYYFYGESGVASYTDTQFDITSNSNKNSSILYATIAGNNYVPSAFSYIKVFNGRLWGSINNVVYYSLKSQSNKYFYERFDTSSNFNTYQYTIRGIFSLHEHLYFNTSSGMIRQPFGDPAMEMEFKDRRYYFKYPRTVVEYRGYLIGLTEDGIRAFNGEIFSNDISRDVKSYINDIYTGAQTGNQPTAEIYKRNDQSEYHISYRDTSISTTVNNRRLVFNFDDMSFSNDGQNIIIPCIGRWNVGAHYFAVNNAGTMYQGQASTSDSVIYTEKTDTVKKDENIYIGDTYETSYVPEILVRSPIFSPSIKGNFTMLPSHIIGRFGSNYIVKLYYETLFNQNASNTISESGGSTLWDQFNWDEGYWSSESPNRHKIKWPMKSTQRFFIDFIQTVQDDYFRHDQMYLEYIVNEGRFI